MSPYLFYVELYVLSPLACPCLAQQLTILALEQKVYKLGQRFCYALSKLASTRTPSVLSKSAALGGAE